MTTIRKTAATQADTIRPVPVQRGAADRQHDENLLGRVDVAGEGVAGERGQGAADSPAGSMFGTQGPTEQQPLHTRSEGHASIVGGLQAEDGWPEATRQPLRYRATMRTFARVRSDRAAGWRSGLEVGCTS